MMSWGREMKLHEPEEKSEVTEENLCSPHKAGQPRVSPDNREKWKSSYFKVFSPFFSWLLHRRHFRVDIIFSPC